MAVFVYKVTDRLGNIKAGEINAASEAAAISALQGDGLIVIEIREKAEKKSLFSFLPKIKKKVPMKDMVMMIRQFAVLVQAQVPMVVTLELVAGNTKNQRLSDALKNVAESVKSGRTIAQSLADQGDVFSDFFVNMVAAGEESGNLSQSLNMLADYIERQYELGSKIKGALMYPMFVVIAFVGVMTLMMTVIIPKMGDIIKTTGVQIPQYTAVVLSISDFMVNYWPVMLVVVFVLASGLFYFVSSPRNKVLIDSLKLKVPFLRDLFKMVYLSRISFNMYTMFTSGISVLRTLEITASVVGNEIYKKILLEVSEDVRSGNMISAAMSKHEELPNILVQMIRVGEETGSMGLILKTLGEFYKKEVDNTVDTIIGLIEPAMIIFLGGAVGILLASVMLPIYNIAGSIG